MKKEKDETKNEETGPEETEPAEDAVNDAAVEPEEPESGDEAAEKTPVQPEETEPGEGEAEEAGSAQAEWTTFNPERGRLLGAGTKLILGGAVVTLSSPAYVEYPKMANERYFFGLLMVSSHPNENIDANAILLDNKYDRATGAVVED